ncbi:hypothetical protein KJ632_02395 [Patescibacteria group bacterium]|nr:hypothetical protein [Patescibacteria group bacterium]
METEGSKTEVINVLILDEDFKQAVLGFARDLESERAREVLFDALTKALSFYALPDVVEALRLFAGADDGQKVKSLTLPILSEAIGRLLDEAYAKMGKVEQEAPVSDDSSWVVALTDGLAKQMGAESDLTEK